MNALRLSLATAAVSLVAAHCCAQTYLTADTILSPDEALSQLHRFDDEMETLAIGPVDDAAFHGVTRLGDNILVADYRTEVIQRFALDGTLLPVFANYQNPVFLESDSRGAVYTSSAALRSAVATRFDSSGAVTQTFTSPTANMFVGIDADAEGNVYIATGDAIEKYAPNGDFLSATPIDAQAFDMSIDEQGQVLYLTDSGAPLAGVRRYDISSGAPVLDGTIPTPAESAIAGLHYSPQLGTLFATDQGPLSGDPRGMQLALDGTLLATYRPEDIDVALDIVYVPEPMSALLLAGAVMGVATGRKRSQFA